MTPTLPLAFAAGVLSFLSPCVLPLVPSYLAYVGGSAQAERRILVRNALFFVLGFGLVFVAMGASASFLGSLLRANQQLLTVVGGVLVGLFGLVLLGLGGAQCGVLDSELARLLGKPRQQQCMTLETPSRPRQ